MCARRVSTFFMYVVAETHGSERSWLASDAEIVNRGDWRVSVAACAPTTASEMRNQENMPTAMVDVGRGMFLTARARAAPRRVTEI